MHSKCTGFSGTDSSKSLPEGHAGVSVGLLINFGKQKVEFKRFAYSQ